MVLNLPVLARKHHSNQIAAGESRVRPLMERPLSGKLEVLPLVECIPVNDSSQDRQSRRRAKRSYNVESSCHCVNPNNRHSANQTQGIQANSKQ